MSVKSVKQNGLIIKGEIKMTSEKIEKEETIKETVKRMEKEDKAKEVLKNIVQQVENSDYIEEVKKQCCKKSTSDLKKEILGIIDKRIKEISKEDNVAWKHSLSRMKELEEIKKTIEAKK